LHIGDLDKYEHNSEENKPPKKNKEFGFNRISPEKVYKKRVYKERKKTSYYGTFRNFKEKKQKEFEWIDEIKVEEGLPYFLQKENLKDKAGKRPEESDYDSTTLHVPEEYFNGLTPAMQQYWSLKADNYDKLLLFKLGKFYELFYEDAIIGNRLLDLNWMGSIKKYHVGFPEKALNKYLSIIVNHGYKAAVVEQIETPKMRNKRRMMSQYKEPKVVLRELWNIYSKGTYINPFRTSYDARWVLAFSSDFEMNVGIVFFDISTLKLNIGQFKDDEMLNKFRTLCSQLRPIEIIYNKDKQNPELVKILENSPSPPAKSDLPSILWGNAFDCLTKLDKYFTVDKSKWPKTLVEVFQKLTKAELALCSLGMTISYLQKSMLDEQVVKLATYQLYDPGIIKTSKMILDAQALEHLQILDRPGTTLKEKTGSLFMLLDHTSTKFGKRAFKRWVTTPLWGIKIINERLNAVEDLMWDLGRFEQFRKSLKLLPDLEKKISTVYQYSIHQNKKAIYFENINLRRLTEFSELMTILKHMPNLIKPLSEIAGNFKSKRLRELVSINKIKQEEVTEDQNYFETLDDDRGLFPDLSEELVEFESMITWVATDKGNNIPQPKQGLDEIFDAASEQVKDIKANLYDYLLQVRRQFKDENIKFSHAKYRYELEIPEDLVKGDKKPQNYEFTSSIRGFQRFHTNEIKWLVDSLEEAEELMNQALVPFIWSVFEHFHSKKGVWDRLVSCLSELDWLCSLAWVSLNEECDMTRPEFIDFEENKFHSYLELREMRHPGVVSTGIQFVPNDTIIGKRYDWGSRYSFEAQRPNTLLISGPNMGGKSTLLRQTWIAVIMAQIGCYVPAKSWILTPVDRIFTRIGASDWIFEGKSVFFMEMEDTKQIIENATSQSLVIMDELGRGTSTFDGFAIAKAALNYIHKSIKVRFKIYFLVTVTIHYPLSYANSAIWRNKWHWELSYGVWRE
jgi:DNA mismatch repair protein MSH6